MIFDVGIKNTIITPEDTSLRDSLLLQFCRWFENLYGGDEVTPNMHIHSHLAKCMIDYRPMATFWLLSFERFHGILGEQHTNNYAIELQLMKRFMEDNTHSASLYPTQMYFYSWWRIKPSGCKTCPTSWLNETTRQAYYFNAINILFYIHSC